MPPTTAATRPVSLKLDATLKSRIDALAAAQDRSPHWMMQRAIAQYVEREEAAEQLRREAVAAYEHYAQTGLHLTFEEVDAWLGRIEAGEDAGLPECHV
jgi:predicted transcriptional regulator